jgi:hypothetical protein
MTALTVPFLVIGIALTAPVYAFGVRRLLGLRLPLLRTLVAGVIAVLVASPIITAIIANKPGPCRPCGLSSSGMRSRCWPA